MTSGKEQVGSPTHNVYCSARSWPGASEGKEWDQGGDTHA